MEDLSSATFFVWPSWFSAKLRMILMSDHNPQISYSSNIVEWLADH